MFSDSRNDGLWPSAVFGGTTECRPSLRTSRGHRSLWPRHCLRQITFKQQIFTIAQPWLCRVAANVAHAVCKVIRIPNQAVKVTPLPQFARAFQVKIDLPRRETFPAMQQFFQRPLGMRHHQQMHMIGHHDPGNLAASHTVEMAKRLSHDTSAGRLTEDAFAVTRIQPALHLLRKSFMIFHLLLGRVQWRIPFQPHFTLRLPLITKLLRHRVGQAKGDKIGRSLLLPVRQAVECLLNLRVRIEKLHTRKNGLRAFIIQPILP